jgi:predicted SnoaL-like aldol condensation-catalyzing enzyme
MGAAENKALVLRFYDEVWALGNLEFVHEVFADEYVRHDLRPSDPAPGPEGQAKIAGSFRSAFPDLEWRVDLVLGDGDLVAARWTAAGTHSGAWGEVAPRAGGCPSRASMSSASAAQARSSRSGITATIWA